MDNLNLNEEIKASRVIVHKGRFAYLKTDAQQLGDHFLISKDADEVTIVTEEKNVKGVSFLKQVNWFKLFEVQANTPFLCVGFIASMTWAIADTGLNVLVVSTFSKDYLLIREEGHEKGVDALKELGFRIVVE